MGSDGSNYNFYQKLTLGGLIITLGIIYGDIGTSPLYVMQAIIGQHRIIDRDTVLGGVSLVFWTLTFQTTFKYILLTLRADNKGEGGIFSLYTLVAKRGKWLIYPAILGGAAMLADGIITPPISVASAVQGLEIKYHQIEVVTITIIILSGLFIFQRYGTEAVGKSFGPVMFIWFTMLAVLGLAKVIEMPEVFASLNPYYAFELLLHNERGLLILGAVFLCTTGAEALYADLGHCGRKNIQFSWIFVKTCLVLNYLGQAAWLIQHSGQELPLDEFNNPLNPFYGIMPQWFLWPGIIISTLAAIIASQALISGSFTLASEAIRLGLLPKMTVKFPSRMKGQLYLPAVNTFLWAGCVGVVLYFRKSSNMEAAYGLAIIGAMLCTTILLANYLVVNKVNKLFIGGFLLFYLLVEGGFLVANSLKFLDGGFVTVAITGLLFFTMWLVIKAKKIRRQYTGEVSLDDYLDQLISLSNDQAEPKYATNLVFLSGSKTFHRVEEKILYSILQTQPKRADIYWFVHIQVTDEPYTMEYKVDTLAPDDVYKITFLLGFRVEQRLNLFLKKVVEDLIDNGEVNILSRYHISRDKIPTGDFKYVILQEFLSQENDLPFLEQLIMSVYLAFKGFTASPQNWFGLDSDSVEIEKVPLILQPVKGFKLKRLK